MHTLLDSSTIISTRKNCINPPIIVSPNNLHNDPICSSNSQKTAQNNKKHMESVNNLTRYIPYMVVVITIQGRGCCAGDEDCGWDFRWRGSQSRRNRFEEKLQGGLLLWLQFCGCISASLILFSVFRVNNQDLHNNKDSNINTDKPNPHKPLPYVATLA